MSTSCGTATVQAGGLGQLDVFHEPGHGEWSYKVVNVQIAPVPFPLIEPRGSRGDFRIVGQLDWEFPTMWPADYNEAPDGPKVPYIWSLTVAGIEIEIARDAAPGIDLRTGVWLSVEVSGLTVWSGS